LAAQLCFAEHDVYLSIRPREVLGRTWQSPNAKVQAPLITSMREQFFKVIFDLYRSMMMMMKKKKEF
jgi:hypothetical protein